jgi:hypothetical protein
MGGERAVLWGKAQSCQGCFQVGMELPEGIFVSFYSHPDNPWPPTVGKDTNPDCFQREGRGICSDARGDLPHSLDLIRCDLPQKLECEVDLVGCDPTHRRAISL